MNTYISVVICTYDHPKLLRDALTSVVGQHFDKALFEIIVVDNDPGNPSRATEETVKDFFGATNVRYLQEPLKGSSAARNTGIKNAKGDYIVTFDDDVRVPEHWLAAAHNIIKRVDPGIMGGPHKIAYEVKKPYWFLDSYINVPLISGPAHFITDESYLLFAANMCFKKSLLEAMGGFNTRFGPQGHNPGGGEETEIQIKTLREMPEEKIYFDPDLWVEHIVRKEELSLLWNIKKRYNYSQVNYVLKNNTREAAWVILAKIAGLAGCALINFLKGLLFRNKKKFRFLPNYLFECTFSYVYKIGLLTAALRAR